MGREMEERWAEVCECCGLERWKGDPQQQVDGVHMTVALIFL